MLDGRPDSEMHNDMSLFKIGMGQFWRNSQPDPNRPPPTFDEHEIDEDGGTAQTLVDTWGGWFPGRVCG